MYRPSIPFLGKNSCSKRNRVSLSSGFLNIPEVFFEII